MRAAQKTLSQEGRDTENQEQPTVTYCKGADSY